MENLGFCNPPRPKYIYCNRKYGGLWYFFQDEKMTPIEHKALHCLVISIDIVKTERNQSDSEKLRIRVQADEQYVLEAGASTSFARGFLTAWKAMTAEQRSNPVWIEPEPGDKPTVLFCKVYDFNGRQIMISKAGVGENGDLVDMVKEVVAGAGMPIDRIRALCQEAGLPDSAKDFTHIDQVNLLRSMLADIPAEDVRL